MTSNGITPEPVSSMGEDNGCVNMLYTIRAPTDEEMTLILDSVPMAFQVEYRSSSAINHSFYKHPSLRPKREPVGKDGFAPWDRVRIIRMGYPDKTGVIINIESENPKFPHFNYLRIHLDESNDAISFTERIPSTDCCMIPWPQHEGLVHEETWVSLRRENY